MPSEVGTFFELFLVFLHNVFRLLQLVCSVPVPADVSSASDMLQITSLVDLILEPNGLVSLDLEFLDLFQVDE